MIIVTYVGSGYETRSNWCVQLLNSLKVVVGLMNKISKTPPSIVNHKLVRVVPHAFACKGVKSMFDSTID